MTKPTIRELLDKEYQRDIRYVSPAYRELAGGRVAANARWGKTE